MFKLRDYQEECIDILKSKKIGKFLVVVATGLGKTAIFTHLINTNKDKRILILSHREELVFQPLKYINEKVGVEQAKNKAKKERIISACVPTMLKRIKNYPCDYFDIIITDEAHHAPCKSYTAIYDYFNPPLHLGFTATPNRADDVRLNSVFDEIVYQKDIRWGIKNNYLSDIYAMRFYMDYDLSKIKTNNGDYQINQLEKAVNTIENATAIAEIYNKHAVGSTLIFGVSVKHCEELGKYIKGSAVITQKTKNRSEIINRFTSGEIKCLINCQIFTEGTDIPCVETLIIARPTKNSSFYTQMVGRGLRLYPGKKELLLIDCCGVTGMNLCTAPSLLGVDIYDDGKKKTLGRDELIEGNLFDLPEKIAKNQDKPDFWKINYKLVDLWAKGQGYNTHQINFDKMNNGDLSLSLPNINFIIKAPDELGKTLYHGKKVDMQEVIDKAYVWLNKTQEKHRGLWDLSICSKWGKRPISEKQANLIKRFLPNYDLKMTSLEASQIINRLLGRKKKK